MKYRDWLNDWLSTYIKTSVKGRTYEKYKSIASNTIAPVLGDSELQDLTLMQLQRFVATLSENGIAASSVNGIICVIKSSLKYAVLVGAVSTNVSAGIQRPKLIEKKIDCFTLKEQRRLEKYILQSKRKKLYGVIIALYTGLRLGELLSLKWSDVDMKNERLSVTATCRDSWQDGKYVKILTAPKTRSSYRTIPIPKQVIHLIKELKTDSTGEYVICGRTMFGVGIRSYQRTFETLLTKLKLPHRGFHALRHTFATRALECGVDIKTLSDVLGHKNTSITLDRYVHSLDGHKVSMMNRLGKLLQ